MPTNGGEAASLVESAMLLRWRAPELALLLADRAVTTAQDDKTAVLQAERLAIFALNRLGRHGEAAHRLFPAVRDADTSPELRHELNVELAYCAVALDEPVIALDAVRTVLAAGEDVVPALRGRALVAVAEASVTLCRDDLVTSVLDEADELYCEDSSLDHDTALLLRASARAVGALRHRRRAATAQAEVEARKGRKLLAGLADPDHDSGEVSARLMLEIVLALLDRGAGDAATQEARSLLRRPVRAAAAGLVGRLRLALATRVHLTEGRHEPALTLLADAVEGAQRHGVDAVLAECLEGLSYVHEARGEFADALHCMRASRAAEGRHHRDVQAARSTLLANCGTTSSEETRLLGEIAVLLGDVGTGCAGLDSDPGPLSTETSVDVAGHQSTQLEVDQPCILSSETVDLPAEVTSEVKNPHLVPSDTGEVMSAEFSSWLDPCQLGARHRRGADALVSVSDLLPPAALSPGRSGRRRAAEPTEDRGDDKPVAEVDQTPPSSALALPSEDEATSSVPAENSEEVSPTRRGFPDSGPPSAPTPRVMEWEAVDGDPTGEQTVQMDVLSVSTAVRAETNHEAPRYRVLGTRWAVGLALAPKLIDGDDPASAITNPLLRLPDLTAEPQWAPPETIRRPAVGD